MTTHPLFTAIEVIEGKLVLSSVVLAGVPLTLTEREDPVVIKLLKTTSSSEHFSAVPLKFKLVEIFEKYNADKEVHLRNASFKPSELMTEPILMF